MPTWLKRLFGIADPPPLWLPVYQPMTTLSVSEPDPAHVGFIASQGLNQQDFVTRESAYYLAGLYGATVTEDPWQGAGGPDVSIAKVFTLHWPGGWQMNAGSLAIHYCPAVDPDNPSLPGKPAQATLDNPQIAVTLCNQTIAAARADYLHLVR